MLRRLLGIALAALAIASACEGSSSTPVDTSHQLTVLAGSELKDLVPMLPDIQRVTGYQLVLKYTGSLDGAQAIVDGTDHSDLAWFSTGNYLTLLQGNRGRITAQQPIMLSPVVIGVKHSVAQSLGWSGSTKVTWADIANAAKAGQFHFGMTNPASSNSGFVALVGVASAFAGSGNSLDSGSINVDRLKDFFSGQSLTAGSSGFLADSYVRNQDRMDGLINYESVLLSLNAAGKLHEQLDLVYPKDGIITANYPLMLLNSSKRDAYDKLVAYLRSPDVQKKIMAATARRPSIPDVQPDSRFTTQLLVELPFPSNISVVDNLIFAYLDEIRPPAHTYFVLDISGSMEGDRLNGVKKTFDNLTGADQTITGRFSRLRAREEITIIPFNGSVVDDQTFTINDVSASSPDLAAVRHYVDNLQANDGTAIYDALIRAYNDAAAGKRSDPDRFYSVVLMTDGENNMGHDAGGFARFYNSQPADVKAIPTFAIIFGEASPQELTNITTLTGGQAFDSRNVSLASVFKVIRGYQ
ncbi:MAG TPA: substrate-binding and VWA domain-containing protein [Candidatus Dormibacteraeota bacterium]|nr:substrate-binding and VWA domain-containing protein [Candidatus Dormibacteraeota bacterium]